MGRSRRVFRNPRVGVRGHFPPRPTSEARVNATRVYPGRGAPRFASARRHGAGNFARRGISATLFAHDCSLHTSTSFSHGVGHMRADRVRGARGAIHARLVMRGVRRDPRRARRGGARSVKSVVGCLLGEEKRGHALWSTRLHHRCSGGERPGALSTLPPFAGG